MKKLDGNVKFEHVSYQADDEDILHDINFDVKKGETVGIIGTTGAGQAATLRGLEILQNLGCDVRILQIEGAKDPDEYELFDIDTPDDLIRLSQYPC